MDGCFRARSGSLLGIAAVAWVEESRRKQKRGSEMLEQQASFVREPEAGHLRDTTRETNPVSAPPAPDFVASRSGPVSSAFTTGTLESPLTLRAAPLTLDVTALAPRRRL